MRYLGSVSFLFILLGGTCQGFAVPRSSASAVRAKVLHHQEGHHSSSTQLYYRQLSKEDDDTTMQQIRIRTPPGYDMKEAIKLPKTGINTGLLKAL